MVKSFKEEVKERLIQFVEQRKDLLKHRIIDRLNYDGGDLACITHNMMCALLRSSLCGHNLAVIENFGRFATNETVVIFEANMNAIRQLYDKLQDSSPGWVHFFNNWRVLNYERTVRVLGRELEMVKERSGVEIAEIAYHTWVSMIVWALLNKKCVNIDGIGQFVFVGGAVQYAMDSKLREDLVLSLKPWPSSKLKIDRDRG